MNATPPNLNPVNTVQTQTASGKQQDAAAPDVPFSQVLSSEIAQNRRSSEAREEPRVMVDSEAVSPPDSSSEAGTTSTTQAPETEASTRKSLESRLAENNPSLPDAMLSLAIHPDLLKPAPTSTNSAPTEKPAALGASMPTVLDAQKGPARLALQAGQLANETAGAQKPDPTPTGKADFQAAMAATSPSSTAAAAAISGQLAATRQSDAMKAGERLPDLMSNPAMAPTPHALLYAASSLDSLAANKLAPSVGTTAWSQALGEKIVWMAAGAQQTASLTLNPPNLGPLQIVLNVSNDQATASFFSAQPEVRQALEAAFPKLREMMNEAGIQLGQATVSADTPRQNDASDRQAQRTALPFIGADDDVTAGLQTVQVPALKAGRGLVDTFA
jgi:flagellar hook-length control protein FliK